MRGGRVPGRAVRPRGDVRPGRRVRRGARATSRSACRRSTGPRPAAWSARCKGFPLLTGVRGRPKADLKASGRRDHEGAAARRRPRRRARPSSTSTRSSSTPPAPSPSTPWSSPDDDQGRHRHRRHRPDRVRQGPGRRPRSVLALRGHQGRARRRRHRAGRGRRPVVVHARDHRRGRHRPQPRPRRHHLLQPGRLRRRRRLRGRRPRRHGRGHRSVQRGRGLAQPQAGRRRQPSVEPGGQPGRRLASVDPAVRPAATGRRDRHAGPPLLPRVRRHPGAAGRRRASPSASTPTATRRR